MTEIKEAQRNYIEYDDIRRTGLNRAKGLMKHYKTTSIMMIKEGQD